MCRLQCHCQTWRLAITHVMCVTLCVFHCPFGTSSWIVLLTARALPASSDASKFSNCLVRRLEIQGKRLQVFTLGYAQVFCDDCVPKLDQSGIVHVMLNWRRKRLLTSRLYRFPPRRRSLSSVEGTRNLCVSCWPVSWVSAVVFGWIPVDSRLT